MAKEITTKAIDNVINNPKKLEAFVLHKNRKEATPQEYVKTLARRGFTLAEITEANKKKFSKFLELITNTNVDFAYLCKTLANAPEFIEFDFKINPILELYEELLKENWEIIKSDRETLDSIDALNITPDSNITICQSILTFLKEHVLTKALSNDL